MFPSAAPILAPVLTSLTSSLCLVVAQILAFLSSQCSSLPLRSSSPLLLVLAKTPLELSASLIAQKLEENKAMCSLCSYEPHGDWEPPPGRMETGLT